MAGEARPWSGLLVGVGLRTCQGDPSDRRRLMRRDFWRRKRGVIAAVSRNRYFETEQMADILSTLRELRSLEEKRAHGTLSPGEEQRFQELQALMSSRGPKPGPPTPIPLPSSAASPLPV